MVSADELANARSLAAAASEELERRRLRALFAQRGQRGEDGVLRGGLMDFVRHFWHILEPATDFVTQSLQLKIFLNFKMLKLMLTLGTWVI